MNEQDIHQHLSSLNGWQLASDLSLIQRDFKFRDFHQTMRFVNAVAEVAHAEDHHPDIEIGYNHCLIKYTTHSKGGLTSKDFSCAQQIDQLPNNI